MSRKQNLKEIESCLMAGISVEFKPKSTLRFTLVMKAKDQTYQKDLEWPINQPDSFMSQYIEEGRKILMS